APTRGSGRNHRRQMEQGLFRGAGIVTHHRHAPPTGRAVKSSEVGHFSRAEIGNFSRAPKPLPVVPFVFAEWKRARVNLDYHVELEGHYYSTPYQLVGKEVEIHYTASTV